MSLCKDYATKLSQMYSDCDPDAAFHDKTDTVLADSQLCLGPDGEGNIVHDRNGNIDCSNNCEDETEPLVMLGCKKVSSNHKMVRTSDEAVPAVVRHGNVITEDNLRSKLWSNDGDREDRKLLSDSSAACKKMCANICGKIMDYHDDCEVTRWTVLPVKQDDDFATTADSRCEFKTCGKTDTKLINASSNLDDVCRYDTSSLDKSIFNSDDVSSTVPVKSRSSTLVSNTTRNSNVSSTHPRTSKKRMAPKGPTASKQTPSQNPSCSAGHESSESLGVLKSGDCKHLTEEINDDELSKLNGHHKQANNRPCGKKTIHKTHHVGRKNRTKSKSVGETVELKLKVNRQHDPCQLVSCTPLRSDSSSITEAADAGDQVISTADLDNDQIDAHLFTPVKKTHSKRSLSKTMSVCLDDSVSASSHQRVRIYGYEYDSEPIHMTLEEVKASLQRLYGQKGLTPMPVTSSSTSSATTSTSSPCNDNHTCYLKSSSKSPPKKSGGAFHIHLRPKKGKDGSTDAETKERLQNRKSFPSSIKQTFCSLFGTAKKSNAVSLVATDEEDDIDVPVAVSNRGHSKSSEELSSRNDDDEVSPNLLNTPSRSIPSLSPFVNRALPPLPLAQTGEKSPEDEITDVDGNTVICEDWDKVDEEPLDFTASIQQVKDYGWYWGPISGELAEKILANEPDGSFIVRDSSDEHYIFSLTFKLNGLVRHVRIEHDQGNFSFGTFTNFKSQTIVGFIENAVKHSRSGRYLFFLHRRPVLGPMRVQLLHPVSRFKQVQSLQHMCRFVILKAVRRDLIYSLPLPKRLKDYLNTPQYYTEDIDGASDDDHLPSQIHPAVTPEQNLLHGAMPEEDR